MATQFEAYFVQSMLKSMRAAMPEGGLFGSNGEDMFRELFDREIALGVARHGGFGLADTIHGQIDKLQGGSQAIEKPAEAAATTSASSSQADASKVGFISRVLDAAEHTAKKLGVAVEGILAQAALETGWGRKGIKAESGAESHNLFGIKAQGGWQGEQTQAWTHEYSDGVASRMREPFRAYDSDASAFADYADLIGRRYPAAQDQGADVRGFAKALQEGGYATDPNYADKIAAIANSPRLRDALAAARAERASAS